MEFFTTSARTTSARPAPPRPAPPPPALTPRLLLAGGFAVAASCAPLMVALTSGAGPDSPTLAQCPEHETLDTSTGACRPASDKTPTTYNPIDPGITDLQTGSVTSAKPGEVGELPEINGIPCQGDNTGLCIGLQQQNAAKANVPHIDTGVHG